MGYLQDMTVRDLYAEVLGLGGELAKIDAAIDGFIVGYGNAHFSGGTENGAEAVSLRFDAMQQPMFSFLSAERERLRRRLVTLNERMTK